MKAVKCRETASKHFDMNNIEVRRSSLAHRRQPNYLGCKQIGLAFNRLV